MFNHVTKTKPLSHRVRNVLIGMIPENIISILAGRLEVIPPAPNRRQI